MHHGLFVARLVVAQQVAVLLQRLAHACDVAVAKDTEAAVKEAVAQAVALHILHGEETHKRLGGGEPFGGVGCGCHNTLHEGWNTRRWWPWHAPTVSHPGWAA